MLTANRRIQLACFLSLLLMLAGAASATSTKKPKAKSSHLVSTHSSSRHHSSKHATTKTARSHGQHGIDSERTREIQEALIQQHYLSGEPTGVWDQSTKDALTRYQATNGWQTKITPDSRALIKLGLGPDHKGLLNPETASIPAPHELGVDNQAQPGGSADQQ